MIPEQTTVILDIELYHKEGIWWQNQKDPFRVPPAMSQEVKTILGKIKTIQTIDSVLAKINQATLIGRDCVEKISLLYEAENIGKVSKTYERVEFYSL